MTTDAPDGTGVLPPPRGTGDTDARRDTGAGGGQRATGTGVDVGQRSTTISSSCSSGFPASGTVTPLSTNPALR